MKRPRLPSAWSHPGQTRSRVLILCVMAALPIALMAVVIVMQDYREVSGQAAQRAVVVEGQVLAEVRSQFAIASSAAVAAASRLGVASSCPKANGAAAQAKLIIIGADGAPRCDLPLLALPSWFERAKAGAPFSLGLFAANGPFIVAAPTPDGRVAAEALPAAWLAATLPDRMFKHDAAWLLDDQHRIAASVGDLPDALPTLPIVAALLADHGTVVRGVSAADQRYAYATSDLAGGWKLVVAVDVQAEHRRAIRVLLLRAGELGVLLLAGLAAIMFFADVAFGAPLRRLSDGVQAWRAGQVFSPGDLLGAPDEVKQLARSFAEATRRLHDKESELLRAQEQQTLLILEVHHRVKNNLQIVASLLNLQASRIRVPETRAEFQAARDRVRALATLHRHLYADGELHMINMRSFLAELCGQLFQAMGETEGQRIKLLIDAPELRISSDEGVPLALIVTEIVTNSVKYAFPGGRDGSISVILTIADTGLELAISDDGVGIGAADAAGRERDGIGLRLIRGFCRQLGAAMEVQHGHGTRYLIRLPSSRVLNRRVRADALDAALSGEETVSL